MTIKQKTLILSTILITLFSIVAVNEPVHANSGLFGGNIFSRLIDFLAQKFNLEKSQVQNAVSEFQKQIDVSITPHPTPNSEQIAAREKQRLDILVNKGNITSEQETAIISELQKLRDKYPFMSPDKQALEERQAQFQNLNNDWNLWAQKNGIDPNLVHPFVFGWSPEPHRNYNQGNDDISGDNKTHGLRESQPKQTLVPVPF